MTPNYQTFLDQFFAQIAAAKLDISGMPLDHIAYQASSAEDYEQHLPEFSHVGALISEEMIANRRVAVYELATPLTYRDYHIPAVELIEPRAGQVIDSGFQHAEFVINVPFEEYMKKYPELNWDTSSMYRDEFSHLKLNFANGMTLKFLLKPILELVANK